MKVKGIRDILSINSFVRRATPRTRAQVAAELARLEHEKERFERELELRRQTEARLQLTQERIKFLVTVLEDLPGSSDETPAAEPPTNNGRETKNWSEVTIEY